jgi:NAD(P)-dependent dehydrogenase (short-subunit alcohol dehydrogenase family)
VYLAARSEEKAAAAMAELKETTKSERIEFLKLDLADLPSVKVAAVEFQRCCSALCVIGNGAQD